MWHVTCDMYKWHMTCDMWHMTCDTWVWDRQCLEDSEVKNHSLNEWTYELVSDRDDCRTAPAALSLLNVMFFNNFFCLTRYRLNTTKYTDLLNVLKFTQPWKVKRIYAKKSVNFDILKWQKNAAISQFYTKILNFNKIPNKCILNTLSKLINLFGPSFTHTFTQKGSENGKLKKKNCDKTPYV